MGKKAKSERVDHCLLSLVHLEYSVASAMKVELKLSPMSYLQLLNRSSSDSRIYAIPAKDCMVRHIRRGMPVGLFHVVADKAEATKLHRFATKINLQAVSEIATSAQSHRTQAKRPHAKLR